MWQVRGRGGELVEKIIVKGQPIGRKVQERRLVVLFVKPIACLESSMAKQQPNPTRLWLNLDASTPPMF
jgi:hypothetical protein